MRHFTLLLVVLLTATLSAQIKKGTQLTVAQVSANDLQLRPQLAVPISRAFIERLPDANLTYASFGGNYGVAVRDEVAVGGSVQADFTFGENGTGADYLMVCPWARYYPYNEPDLQAFGQLQTGIVYTDDEVDAFSTLITSAGLHVPVGKNIRLTPTLSYAIRDGSNRLGLGAHVEYHFYDDTSGIDPANRYRQGNIMIGGQVASLDFTENSFNTNVRLGGQYFVTDRWTAGLDVGINYNRVTFENGSSGSKPFVRTSDYTLGLNSRYYVATERPLSYFGEAGAGYVSRGHKSSFSSGAHSDGFPYFRVGVGAQMPVCGNLLLEAGPDLRFDFHQETAMACGFFLSLWYLFMAAEAE